MKKAALCFLLILMFCLPAFSQTGAAPQSPAPSGTASSAKALPTDAVIVLDLSGSMRKNAVFAEVKTWLKGEFVTRQLREGDRFTLIGFGKSAETKISYEKLTAADIAALPAKIEALQPGEDFTDLGRALESMDAAMSNRKDASFRPMGIFITDGKHAPPPESPWSGKNLALDEHFLSIGQRIGQKGWFLYVISLGKDTDANVVSKAVPGSTLVNEKAGLSGEGLAGYGAAVDQKAEQTLAGQGGPAFEAGKASGGSGSWMDGKVGPFPFTWKVLGLALGIIIIVLGVLVFTNRRRKDDDEPQKPKQPLV